MPTEIRVIPNHYAANGTNVPGKLQNQHRVIQIRNHHLPNRHQLPRLIHRSHKRRPIPHPERRHPEVPPLPNGNDRRNVHPLQRELRQQIHRRHHRLGKSSLAISPNTSNVRACSIVNTPARVRRNAHKCAPQPNASPNSCAMLRT